MLSLYSVSDFLYHILLAFWFWYLSAYSLFSVKYHSLNILNHLFGVHGRYTFGFFSLFGNDYVAKQYGGKYKYSMIGFEFIQELIVGNKWLYLSAGIGPSVIVSGHRTTQRPSGKFGFTTLNWASQVAIGHRFDCGLVAEIMIKHYSNGNLGEVNNGQSLYGFALRYVF